MTAKEALTVEIEIHATETFTLATVRNIAEKQNPGFRATNARRSQVRCRHGHVLWIVDLDER